MNPTAPAAARWLLRRPDAEARVRIFCFPYSGVGASMFSRWPRFLDGAELCPIQLPARENRIRDPHYGTYQALAENLAEALVPHLDRPFLFIGHCTGSLPAVETAYRLAELSGPVPDRVVVSAQVPPHRCPYDRFLDMTDEQLSDELSRLIRDRGGQPHPLLLELALTVLHQDLGASRTYRRDTPLRLPSGLTVLHWLANPEVTVEQLQDWQDYAEDVRFVELAGGHDEFLAAPPALLGLLTSMAAAAGANS